MSTAVLCRTIYVVVSLAAATGCQRATTTRTLEKGLVLEVLSAEPSDGTFWIEYCSSGAQSDRDRLRPEVGEVIGAYRNELSAVQQVVVSPTDCDWHLSWDGWVPSIISERSTTFSFVRQDNGTWRSTN